MNTILRRFSLGALSGAAASLALLATLGHPAWVPILAIAVGVVYCAGVRPMSGAYVDNFMAGGALGVPLWGLISVIAMPLLAGQTPEWSAEQMRQHFPALVGWVVYGASLGLVGQALNDVAQHLWGPEAAGKSAEIFVKNRIVILGGGFAGMRTAEFLEEKLRKDFSISLTLINETNALLFTPMLAEVAGGSLEPSHISTPLRSSLRRTEFIRGTVIGVDLEKRVAFVQNAAQADGARNEIPFDQLVFALGSVSNYLGMANLEKYSINFKSLLDAIRIRNHVIEMFERADNQANASLRASLLTFVIAGGGFAGVELAGALNDFAHGILADYPKIGPGEVSVVLVHSRDRILPELSESLGRYAQEKMAMRGVNFRLNSRLVDARPGVVVLNNGEIATETLVWTAGTTPNPVLASLPLQKDKRGALVVNPSLLWMDIPDCGRRGTVLLSAMQRQNCLVLQRHSSHCGKRK